MWERFPFTDRYKTLTLENSSTNAYRNLYRLSNYTHSENVFTWSSHRPYVSCYCRNDTDIYSKLCSSVRKVAAGLLKDCEDTLCKAT